MMPLQAALLFFMGTVDKRSLSLSSNFTVINLLLFCYGSFNSTALHSQIQHLEISFPPKSKCSGCIELLLLLKPDSDQITLWDSTLHSGRAAEAISGQAVGSPFACSHPKNPFHSHRIIRGEKICNVINPAINSASPHSSTFKSHICTAFGHFQDGDPTATLGWLFQCLTTLPVKEFS